MCFDYAIAFTRILGMLRFSGVSLVTFFAPAKKVTRWPEGTAEALFFLPRIADDQRARSKWMPAYAGMTSKERERPSGAKWKVTRWPEGTAEASLFAKPRKKNKIEMDARFAGMTTSERTREAEETDVPQGTNQAERRQCGTAIATGRCSG